MNARVLVEAWATLVALSAATVVLTLMELTDATRIGIAGGVLALSGLKARTILGRYLRLNQSQFWTRLFDAAIAVFLAIAFTVYLMGLKG